MPFDRLRVLSKVEAQFEIPPGVRLLYRMGFWVRFTFSIAGWASDGVGQCLPDLIGSRERHVIEFLYGVHQAATCRRHFLSRAGALTTARGNGHWDL